MAGEPSHEFLSLLRPSERMTLAHFGIRPSSFDGLAQVGSDARLNAMIPLVQRLADEIIMAGYNDA